MTTNVIIRHETTEWNELYIDTLSPLFPELTFHAAHTLDDAMKLAAQTQVIIGIGPWMPASLIAAMPKLEWIQSLTTGLDHFQHMDVLSKQVPVTRVAGIHGPQVSELALMLMMALTRRLPAMLDAQKAHQWDRWVQPALLHKTLCILGLGSIAETLARYTTTLG
ncbi:MAG: hypothetical protein KTR35_21725, partial [Gammaproteobacteria bacterium]|nr:hypothetical protein [Gammaproteobacteria bacterium]